jgi:hypothetical protein
MVQKVSKLTTVLMGFFALLFSPVLLLLAAFMSLLVYVVGVLICGGISKPVVGCSSCESNLCPWSVAIGLFIALPLTLICTHILRRRQRHRS